MRVFSGSRLMAGNQPADHLAEAVVGDDLALVVVTIGGNFDDRGCAFCHRPDEWALEVAVQVRRDAAWHDAEDVDWDLLAGKTLTEQLHHLVHCGLADDVAEGVPEAAWTGGNGHVGNAAVIAREQRRERLDHLKRPHDVDVQRLPQRLCGHSHGLGGHVAGNARVVDEQPQLGMVVRGGQGSGVNGGRIVQVDLQPFRPDAFLSELRGGPFPARLVAGAQQDQPAASPELPCHFKADAAVGAGDQYCVCQYDGLH